MRILTFIADHVAFGVYRIAESIKRVTVTEACRIDRNGTVQLSYVSTTKDAHIPIKMIAVAQLKADTYPSCTHDERSRCH